jgi:hypothetical protein
VLPALSFEGLQALLYSAVAGLAIMVWWRGTMAIIRSQLTWRSRTAGIKAWWTVEFIVLLLLAWAIPGALQPTDWDFVLQRMAVLALWALAFLGVQWLAFTPSRRFRVALSAATALAIATVACYGIGIRLGAGFATRLSAQLDSNSGSNVSFATASAIVSRTFSRPQNAAFYAFMKRNTHLGQEVKIAQRQPGLVDRLVPTAGPKPNIFIFVIDSLRQDYLSPYNPSVDFTPEIGRFAHESVVFEHPFTRYAGTALSEPAIWTGAMLPHKQDVEAFAPINHLQQLLEVGGYESYISVDPILSRMLSPSHSITPLDRNLKFWNDLDLVPTLRELEEDLSSRVGTAPIFFYTQPQNVHTLTLARSHLGGSRREISIYEIRRMDGAFGQFLQFLRGRGLYDNSIIILTADHGESYGEYGRYGHADFLFPEVIRIPLIIHLPPRFTGMASDPAQLAFNTDITPTLYYLLGYRPVLDEEPLGRPLFTETAAELAEYQRPSYLLASSYAPVYGILDGDGRRLFISDAVNRKNYLYDLARDPEGAHNLPDPAAPGRYEGIIAEHMDRLYRFYGIRPF